MSLPERHQYGSARGQFGELFLPTGSGPFPVAVVLHGGFWKAQYGRKQTHPVCADLAERGFAAIEAYPDLTRSETETSGARPEFWHKLGFATAVDDERFPVMRREL